MTLAGIAGISGGRTSALMAKRYLAPDVVMTFQNTGFEHPKTITFLERLEQDLGRPIIALEYRAPPRGRPPRESTFEVMSWRLLSMNGGPFLDYLECARTFRETDEGKHLPPIAPSNIKGGRYCTAHLKIKTRRRYAASIGLGTERDYTDFCGLRADEPERVARMKARNDARDTDERAPLFDAGITKADVLAFWSKQPYDLGIGEHLGNCVGCFMKDERDLATALTQDETGRRHAPVLVDIERRYAPMRRQRSSYEQVIAEAPDRMKIRAAIAAGRPTDPLWMRTNLSARRQQLIAKQEQRAAAVFSCACDDAFDVAESEVA